MKKITMRTKDSSSWDVMNPAMLKGREGHHVQLGEDARGRFHGEIIGLADLSAKCHTAKPMNNYDPQNGRASREILAEDGPTIPRLFEGTTIIGLTNLVENVMNGAATKGRERVMPLAVQCSVEHF